MPIARALDMAHHGNQLIARLSEHDQHRLLDIGEDNHFVRGAVLFERGEDAVSAFFPTSGAVALTVPAHSTEGLGIVLVGREGMLGMHHVLGDGLSSMRAVTQAPGHALRIKASDFSQILGNSAALHGALLSYVGAVLHHIATAAACARFHAIGPRLAGWLLMSRDREGGDGIRVTQDALARMLGVRRVGVTRAARELRRLHLIDYHRGQVTVLDADGLRAVAGRCYFG